MIQVNGRLTNTYIHTYIHKGESKKSRTLLRKTMAIAKYRDGEFFEVVHVMSTVRL